MMIMSGLGPALAVEAAKFRRARVPVTTTAMLVGGVALMCVAMLLAVRAGDPTTVAKFGPMVARGGWSGLLASAAQITAVGGLLGFGVVVGWCFGREFTDGTVTGLFGLPVRRDTLAAAKLLVFGAWAVAVSAGLTIALGAAGLLLGFGVPDGRIGLLLVKQCALGLLTALLALPAALAASLGRTVLAGIAMVIGIVVVTQIAVISGLGSWFPFAAPGLWAIGQATGAPPVAPLQLALVTPVALLSAGLTVRVWHTLQLDR